MQMSELTKADPNTEDGKIIYVDLHCKVQLPLGMTEEQFRRMVDWDGISDGLRVYWDGEVTGLMTVADCSVEVEDGGW
jgi:hypothetical protein